MFTFRCEDFFNAAFLWNSFSNNILSNGAVYLKTVTLEVARLGIDLSTMFFLGCGTSHIVVGGTQYAFPGCFLDVVCLHGMGIRSVKSADSN